MTFVIETTPGWEWALNDRESLVVWLDERQTVPLIFRYIPAGEFHMGSRGYSAAEEPIHRVVISKGFFLGAFPVTQQQWRCVVERSDIKLDAVPSDHDYGIGDLHPANNVSWFDSRRWCRALTDLVVIKDAIGFHAKHMAMDDMVWQADLPTECFWEYGCRAGTETDYYSGDGEAVLDEAGWFLENSGGSTQVVGQKTPNQFGLYDMHGNVWEWCLDAFDEQAYKRRSDGKVDPFVVGPPNSERLIRGGGWIISPGGCRSTVRERWRPDDRIGVRGFRVCLFPGTVPVPIQVERDSTAAGNRDDEDSWHIGRDIFGN